MNEEDWDIQEVKRLKKKQLIQLNIAALLLFTALFYLEETEQVMPFIILLCSILWVAAFHSLYVLTTGKSFTITSTRVLSFYKDRLGYKSWKRKDNRGCCDQYCQYWYNSICGCYRFQSCQPAVFESYSDYRCLVRF